MRVIVRFSLNDDRGSRLRHPLKAILEGGGIMWQQGSTGTYEGVVTEADLRDTMRQFWNHVSSYTGRATVDHFWMYCDG